MPYTDLLNEGLDDLTAKLAAVTGLRVVNDATKLIANAVFVDAPSFDMVAGNGNVLKMNFPVKVIGSGPAGLPVLRQLLSIAAAVVNSGAIVMSGSPTAYSIGGADYPCYDLVISIAVRTN
jgi:hypothetical protein